MLSVLAALIPWASFKEYIRQGAEPQLSDIGKHAPSEVHSLCVPSSSITIIGYMFDVRAQPFFFSFPLLADTQIRRHTERQTGAGVG